MDSWRASSASSTSPATGCTTSRGGSSPGRPSDVRRSWTARRSATCTSKSKGCASASKSARTHGSPIAPAARARAPARLDPEPERQPLRVWKAGSTQALGTKASRAFGVAYLYANLLGNEAGRVVYDGGALVAIAARLPARVLGFASPTSNSPPRRWTSSTSEITGRAAQYGGGVVDTGRADAGQARVPSRERGRGSRPAGGLGDDVAREGRGVRARGCARIVRLPAQEPRAGVRGQPERRRGLCRRGVSGLPHVPVRHRRARQRAGGACEARSVQ